MQNTGYSCMQMIQHITHCLCRSNSPSMVLYCWKTHCFITVLHHATCTSSHGRRSGWKAVTSAIQPKFKWFKKLHCRRSFVVASKNKSCNGTNMDRSVFLLQGKIFKAKCIYMLLNATTFETWFLSPNILKLSNATNSSFFFPGTGRYQYNLIFFFSVWMVAEHKKCMHNFRFSQWWQ